MRKPTGSFACLILAIGWLGIFAMVAPAAAQPNKLEDTLEILDTDSFCNQITSGENCRAVQTSAADAIVELTFAARSSMLGRVLAADACHRQSCNGVYACLQERHPACADHYLLQVQLLVEHFEWCVQQQAPVAADPVDAIALLDCLIESGYAD